MSYAEWKNYLFRLCKTTKVNHLIPNNDDLFSYYEQGLTPERVHHLHCNERAQKIRHGLPVEPEEEKRNPAIDAAVETLLQAHKMGLLTNEHYAIIKALLKR